MMLLQVCASNFLKSFIYFSEQFLEGWKKNSLENIKCSVMVNKRPKLKRSVAKFVRVCLQCVCSLRWQRCCSGKSAGIALQWFKSWLTPIVFLVLTLTLSVLFFQLFLPFHLLACLYNSVILVREQLVNISRKEYM